MRLTNADTNTIAHDVAQRVTETLAAAGATLPEHIRLKELIVHHVNTVLREWRKENNATR